MNAPVTIKVTDKENAYFVHFDRDTHELIDVFEYKKIYTPLMGLMSTRTKIVVNLARDRLGKPIEATGDQT